MLVLSPDRNTPKKSNLGVKQTGDWKRGEERAEYDFGGVTISNGMQVFCGNSGGESEVVCTQSTETSQNNE